MSLSMADQLQSVPLQSVPLLSTVIRTDFDLLSENEPFKLATNLLQDWVQEKLRNSPLRPDWSLNYELQMQPNVSLEHASAEEAFTFKLSERDNFGRDWITEVALKGGETAPRLASRLSVRQPRNSAQPLPRAPRFIGDIARLLGVLDFSILETAPRRIDAGNVSDFKALMLSERRQLPIIAISEDAITGTAVDVTDPVKFTRYFDGIAHLAVLDPDAAWAISKSFGKEWSTFQGAIRCYSPGTNLQGDPFQQKLWLRESVRRAEAIEANGFLNQLLRHVFAEVTSQFAPYPLLTPSAVKRIAPIAPSETQSGVVDQKQAEVVESHDHVVEYASPIPDSEPLEKPLEETVAVSMDADFTEMEKTLRAEIVRLEDQLVQAQDETAQKNRELNRIMPFEQEVANLKEELKLLRGEFEDKSSPVLQNFWAGFNLFFESAKNLALQFERTEREVTELGSIKDNLQESEKNLWELQNKSNAKDRRIATLLDSPKNQSDLALSLYPSSWQSLTASVKASFGFLTFTTQLLEQLTVTPFQESLGRGICDLLNILNEVARATQPDGSLNAEGMRLRQQHFVGNNSAFSDESSSNKNDFKTQLTFPDPDDPSKPLFCGWHGKLANQQFRVHFQWPRPEGQKRIKVVYIGPKITKH